MPTVRDGTVGQSRRFGGSNRHPMKRSLPLLFRRSMPRVHHAEEVAIRIRQDHEILTLFTLSEDGRPEL